MANKYLDLNGLTLYHQTLLGNVASSVQRVTANNTDKLTYTTYTFDDDKTAVPHDIVTIDGEVTQNSTNLITSGAVSAAIQGITSAMVFHGGVVASTVDNTTKLTFDESGLGNIKVGYTFKFTANGPEAEAPFTFKTGDILIAKVDITHTAGQTVDYVDANWTIVPSGDDVDVTSVGTSGIGLTTSNSGNAPITSTGTISLKLASDTALTGDTIFNLGVNSSGNLAVKVPTATDSALGLVQKGDNININSGVISVNTATSAQKGVVQIGNNLDVADGVVSVATGSTTGKGVLQVGENLSVNAGVVSVATGDTTTKGVLSVPTAGHLEVSSGEISVPVATASNASTPKFGVVETGANITNTSGVISVAIAESTSGTLGVVKAGTNVSIDGSTGAVSVATGASNTLGLVQADGTSIVTDGDGILTVDTITYGGTGQSTNEIAALFA